MSLFQVVYASQPSRHDEATLNGILADARRRNVEDDITGALICRADIYLQLLEGPISKVKAAYTRINRDDRHHSIRELVFDPAGSRLFPGWAMRDDPARSWLWTPRQIAEGALERASRADILAVFKRIADDPFRTDRPR